MSAQHVVVGVPTYNNADTIGSTLEMLLGQTHLPDRIVCCDNSSDDTRERIRTYQSDDYDTTIEILDQTGDGVADAYNEMLDHIEREYDIFATIQTDLTIDDDWLEGHLAIHDDHPKIDIVTGHGRDSDPTDGEVFPDETPYYTGRNFSAKAGTLERIDGWDTNFLRGEDWDMRIRLAGAGTRVYTSNALRHDWQQPDSYITLSKAKRKPTSVTFLAKYGTWYLKFHPSHVASDLLSVSALVTGVVGLIAMPLSVVSGIVLLILCGLSLFIYTIAHNVLRGGVHGDVLIGPPRKQLLNGIAFFYALKRIVGTNVEWNKTGFDPANIPHYMF